MDDLISRQAAIDAILAVTGNLSVRELYEHVQEHGLSEMWSGGVNAAIDIIIALPSAQPEQKWIPCSERLPEQHWNYLVSYRTDDFKSDIGTFDPDRINSDTGEWSACDANGFYLVASKGLEVIAWMPLPESYKEGQE